jgi:predicted metalloendopeptidase
MVNNIRRVTLNVISNQTWIDNEKKKELKHRLDDMVLQLVYPDNVLTFDSIKKNREITSFIKNDNNSSTFQLSNNFLINKLLLGQAEYSREFDLVGINQTARMRNKKSFFDIFMSNGIYFAEYNTILLPGGIFINPIYDIDHPDYLNYATIGVYVAHEMFHLIEATFYDVLNETTFNYLSRLACLEGETI